MDLVSKVKALTRESEARLQEAERAKQLACSLREEGRQRDKKLLLALRQRDELARRLRVSTTSGCAAKAATTELSAKLEKGTPSARLIAKTKALRDTLNKLQATDEANTVLLAARTEALSQAEREIAVLKRALHLRAEEVGFSPHVAEDIARHKETLHSLALELSQRLDLCGALTENVRRLKREVEEGRRRGEEADDHNGHLTAQLLDTAEQLQGFDDAFRATKDELVEASRRRDSLEERLTSVSSERDALSLRLDDAESRAAASEQQHRESQAGALQAQAKARAHESEARELRRRVGDMQKEAKRSAREARAVQQQAEQAGQGAAQATAAHERASQELAGKEELLSKLKAEMNALLEDLAQQAEQRQAASLLLDEQTHLLDERTRALSKAQHQHAHAAHRAEALEEELERVTNAKETLQRALLEQLTHLRAEARVHQERAERAEEAVAVLRRELAEGLGLASQGGGSRGGGGGVAEAHGDTSSYIHSPEHHECSAAAQSYGFS